MSEAARRVADMRTYGEKAVNLLGSHSLDEFRSDETLRYAIYYLLFVVGEASTQVPAAAMQAMPASPRPNLKGLRNRVAHGYFAIDPRTVYWTAKESVPDLLRTLAGYAHSDAGLA